ncbi:MAG: OmpH family outer membrane protein [Bacteroidales bacterium]|nr:OmpH family outer membrane protein [Bacteroidales bacterium]MCF8454409.1 OmpH family outer membrane protein [Bacteroidales bacterium]
MKKIMFTLSAVILTLGIASAQKYAFVDTEYILTNIPTYESAQDQLDQLSVSWQKEIEAIYTEIDKMYKDFQAEKVLLTEEMKIKRENDIIKKEKDAKDLQKKYFGKDGDLYKKRQELIKPIQDDIFNAVKEIAQEGNYALIFDTAAGGLSMLYTDPKYDKSDDVLEKLGYKN